MMDLFLPTNILSRTLLYTAAIFTAVPPALILKTLRLVLMALFRVVSRCSIAVLVTELLSRGTRTGIPGTTEIGPN